MAPRTVKTLPLLLQGLRHLRFQLVLQHLAEMVRLDVPSPYTFSPSEGTPRLTINREATLDLDSSNAFEGKRHSCSARGNV